MKIFKLVLVAFITLVSFVKAQTIDEILKTYEEKNGGVENFAVINTLQYNSTFKMNMMGRPFDITSQVFIETGKLYRKEVAGMFGMRGVYTLVTDTAGFTFTPSMPSYGEFQGNEGGVAKMDSNLYKSCKHKLNATSEFADLIDCKTKGFIPEFLGKETVDKIECYKIKLTYRNATFKTFWIDATTYLINQIEINGNQLFDFFGIYAGPMYGIMNKRMSKGNSLIKVSDYITVEGIKIPTKHKISIGNNDIDIENSNIKVNEPISDKWYKN